MPRFVQGIWLCATKHSDSKISSV